jgi:hypothetical protein
MSNQPDLVRSALGAVDSRPGSHPDSALDWSDPATNAHLFGKLWGTFGDEPEYGVFHGTMFGSVGDHKLRPLFGYAGTGVTMCRPLADGGVQLRGKETGWFTDLATGEVIDHWDNPFTGERVEVFHFLNDRIGGSLGLEMPRLTMGDAAESTVMNESSAQVRADGTVPFVLPWQRYGDEVLLEWDYAHRYRNPVAPDRYPRASTGEWVNPSEHFTIFTSAAELADPARPSARFRAGFSRVSPWWPWMRMGGSGVEGVLFGRLFSYKARRGLDDVPRPVLDRTARDAPSFLEPPTDWEVGPILSSWEAYARDVAPEM